MSLTIEVGGMTASYAGATSLSPQRLEILLALAGGLSVIDRVQTGPPRRPGVGHRYIVASPAEDEWAGQEGRVAVWVGDAWAFLNPAEGLSAWDEDAAETIQYSSSAWAAVGGGAGGAPTNAEYVVTASNGSLSAERVTTNTATVEWDTGTAGQLKANVPDSSLGSAKLGGDVTTAGKAMLTAADAAAQRSALSLGTLATQSGTFSGTSSGTNTGDQTITLTGDVTGSGTGSFAATIANDAVTYAKMQNVSATDKILGRSSSGAGDIEEITCTSAARDLLDDTTVAAMRTTLEVDKGWTYVVLGSNFSTVAADGTANKNVTGLAFTPAASKTYFIEGLLLMRTATAASGCRPGISWPTGLSEQASMVTSPNNATGTAFRHQGNTTTQNAASTGFASNSDSYLGTLSALMITGGSPSGNFQVTIASEVGTAGNEATMRAGSFIRYREIA